MITSNFPSSNNFVVQAYSRAEANKKANDLYSDKSAWMNGTPTDVRVVPAKTN